MVGIISYGAYVPRWRLSREVIAKGLSGEKAVANWDEDSVTMAVAAAMDCINGTDRQAIDGLFFASTTSPYKEKLMSPTIAAVIDLPRDILTTDFANGLRAGTSAINLAADAVKAGSAKQLMVTSADCRLGNPGSDFELNLGDGAAAFLIGDSNVAVSLEASYSVSNEMYDVWRVDSDTFLRAGEARFIQEEGYLRVVPQAVSGLMKKCNLTPKDFAKAVFYGPDARRHREMAGILGFEKTQVQDPLFATMGNTGTAYPLMLLIAALEEARAGDLILLASYGDGSDACVLRVTEQIDKIRDRRGIKKHLESKRMVPDYDTYLQWRGLLVKQRAPRPPKLEPSPSGLWRERDKNIRLYGVKCKACGTIQYPPQRVCTKCRSKDNFETVRLSDKRGEVFTYSVDYLGSSIEVPQVLAIVNFDGGGRMMCYMADADVNNIKVGLPVDMTFRELFYTAGIHNYFWKCQPIR